MSGIRWAMGFHAALEQAKASGLTVCHDFWFDG